MPAKVITPGVVAADQTLAVARALRDQIGPVAADIGEHLDLPFVAAYHQQRLARQLASKVVAGQWNLPRVAQADPLCAEYRFAL